MTGERPSHKEESAPSAIENIEDYRAALELAGAGKMGISRLDRSEYFRNKKDFEIFADIVEQAPEGSPVRLLEVGVGNMEETVSYLAAAYPNLKGRKLEEAVQTELVEIRAKTEIDPKYRLGKQLLDKTKPVRPKAYRDSFVLKDGEYEPQPEIQSYLNQLVNDALKAHFETPVENFTRDHHEEYDVVSLNNVIQHLGGIDGYPSPYKNPRSESFSRYYEEIGRVLNLVKEGGVIFIHAPAPGDKFDTKGKGADVILNNIPGFQENFEELAKGVYRRKTKVEKHK